MHTDKSLATIAPAARPARATMKDVAARANQISRSVVLQEYLAVTSDNTIRRQEADLTSFALYLDECGLDAGDLQNELSDWQGCDYGLVDGFKRWLVTGGYSIGTVNVRLATIKRYCQLAARAGHITPQSLALIREVKGYTHKDGLRIDERRETTRIGKKKAVWTHIDDSQAEALKALDNPRDALLMALLLNHGLRVSEVSGLTVANFDLEAVSQSGLEKGVLTFYRVKVDKEQKHWLKTVYFDTLAVARVYIDKWKPAEKLFTAEGENALTISQEADFGAYRDWATRAIAFHVRVLGRRVGLEGLSPHDCRHYWATRAVKRGTHVKALQDAGGWRSAYMPLRYAESAVIANEGVIL